MSSFGIIALSYLSAPSTSVPSSPPRVNAVGPEEELREQGWSAVGSPEELREEAVNACLAEAATAAAAAKAGEIGVLNLELVDLTNKETLFLVEKALASVVGVSVARNSSVSATAKNGVSRHGVAGIKCDTTQIGLLQSRDFDALAMISGAGGSGESKSGGSADSKFTGSGLVILSTATAESASALPAAVKSVRAKKLLALVEVTSVEEAKAAKDAGADAVIAKGHEAGGRVGEQTTYVLVQHLIAEQKMPVWAHGGIGLHTAAACKAAGAQGVVLDSQLLLARESALPFEVKQKVATLDGTETTVVEVGGESFRLFARTGHPTVDEMSSALNAGTAETSKSTKAAGKDSKSKGSAKNISEHSSEHIYQLLREINNSAAAANRPLDKIAFWGQDIAFAADFGIRFSSVAGILQAVRQSVEEHIHAIVDLNPLGEAAPLAVAHGTRYPLVQGAMTRVSDTASFALRVAEGGALPFLALALMRKDEVEALVSETKEQLKSMPWGVGILGFVPQQLRQEQMEVISKYRPPYALIAGGRPDQAKAMEDMGIKTYLHVPSPMLLESFIEMGSRRFIFEGKECGGHVGPRSSFVLWEQMITRLLAAIGPRDNAADYHVLFAGGVHNDLSALMVSAMASTLAQRGVRVGALMGTAYLFTREAVESGAIVNRFQKAALKCSRTVLLETGPGHAIRCIDTPYKRVFDDTRKELVLQNKTRDEVREALELMNLGRLRIASKGLVRAGYTGSDTVSDLIKESTTKGKEAGLVTVAEEKQWEDGMYMIGQVAAMHDKVTTARQRSFSAERSFCFR